MVDVSPSKCLKASVNDLLHKAFELFENFGSVCISNLVLLSSDCGFMNQPAIQPPLPSPPTFLLVQDLICFLDS